MYIDDRNSTRHSGFVLSEMMVVMGITTMLVLAVVCFFMLSTRSFAAIFNYVDLDDANRVAMDTLSRDIRQANRVKSFVTNGSVVTLTLDDSTGDLSYSHDRVKKTLTRTTPTESRVLLQSCDTLRFDLRQRNPRWQPGNVRRGFVRCREGDRRLVGLFAHDFRQKGEH